jgi:thiol-disulfide isomerase/thioredoxin
MFKFLLSLGLCFVTLLAIAQQSSAPVNQNDLGMKAVSLKGMDAILMVKNQTSDTVKLKGFIPFYLPVSEENIDAVIAPGKEVTVRIKMNYPDFIQLTSLPLKVYAGPGRTVRCTIHSTTPIKVAFTGDWSAENNYYMAYFQVAQSNQAYYQAGSNLQDFNKFPALADSITQINLNFLNNYKLPLNPSFKAQEHRRLMYNNAFLKHHVLFDKAFKSGGEIKVDTNYYQFDRDIPLTGEQVNLSSEYLWYAVFRLRDLVVRQIKADSLLSAAMLNAVPGAYGQSELGNVLKMRLLYDARARSVTKYNKLIREVTFVNPANRQILDSVCEARFSLPLARKAAPAFRLVNAKGEMVDLEQYKEHLIILNFWAGWCAPCIREFPSENKLYETYKLSKKLVVINICLETPMDTWKGLSAKHQLKVINLFADEKQTTALKRRYNVSAIPRSILIDQDLKVLSNNFKSASQVQAIDLPN